MAQRCQVIHPFNPVFTPASKILILGSLPSEKSREQNFFYGHPRNRFWKVLAAVFDEPAPQTVQAKIDLLTRYDIALWDAIYSCSIKGSSDSSIADVVPTDLSIILDHSNVHTIICNGRTAERYYTKFQYPVTKINSIFLPSTSPANAAYSLDQLVEIWKPVLLKALEPNK
ncbi:DNA-deoxyinosine glycosylase [Erysipelotrichaceae bacterium RD49]|nr:DNA-deoxyinosine glycosylase [Erysipelotrichaceae bacterium RD49]